MGGHELLPAGYVAAETADRGDELADGVLPRDGVVQDRGVHCPSALARQNPGFGDDLGDGRHDPMRVLGTLPTAAANTSACSDGTLCPRVRNRTRPFTAGHRSAPPRFPGPRALENLQHQHRADHRRRNRGPAPPRREQILHVRIREQPPPMLGQKREDTAQGQ
jgi:hypothetical protein